MPGIFNGAFLIHKEQGMTSHDVVFKLRKLIKDKQIGHTGTLDPMATGLLMCLVGPSVKLLPYLGNENKKYSLELMLGCQTDTWDITGKILKQNSIDSLNEEMIRLNVLSLQGPQEFEIPMYSAKKINGVKLYEVAREKKELEVESFLGPKKAMNFWDINNIKIHSSRVSLDLWCSKGSYIRSWVFQMGERLNVGATLVNLKRETIDKYTLDRSQSLLEIEKDLGKNLKPKSYIEQKELVQSFYSYNLSPQDLVPMENGLLSYDLKSRLLNLNVNAEFIFCHFENELLSIVQNKPDLRIKKVFKTKPMV